MTRALELARRGWGRTHPNPMVGCVIVDQGKVVAEGFHPAAGEPHAEVAALTALQASGHTLSEEATLYVTLEPCSTTGRTPPCTEALLASGIRRVAVGATDPNPAHVGAGLEKLREAGVDMVSGILEEECTDLNLLFNHWIVHRRPLLAAKVATTLDGRLATRTGHSKWITGEAARADVARWRRLFPAIAVGAGTVLADNPRLTARLPGEDEWCPLRFVFDAHLNSVRPGPLHHVYSDAHAGRTVVVCAESEDESAEVRRARLHEANITTWTLPVHAGNTLDLDAFRARCAKEAICGVLFEGGSTLLSHLFTARALDYLFAYRAPVLTADEQALPLARGQSPDTMDRAIRLTGVRHATFEDDQLLRGFVQYPPVS